MWSAILELVLLIGIAVLWTLFAGPVLSVHGMNWLSILVYVAITAESTRLCVTARAFFSHTEGEAPKPRAEAEPSKNAAQNRAALRKVS
jgi:hypothetical protein